MKKKKSSKISEIIVITITIIICVAMFLLILVAATIPNIYEYVTYDPETYIPDSGEITTYSAGYGTEGTVGNYDPPPSLFKCIMSVAANIFGPLFLLGAVLSGLHDD